MIAERAAKACALDKDFAYTAGIMHDIGRVVLIVSMPLEYGRLIEVEADQPRDLLPRERELCGIDHCQAGKTLVREWALPEAFSAITSCHHDTGALGTPVGSTVGLSCQLADLLGFGVAAYRSPGCYAGILAAFPEAARSNFPADARELATQIANEIAIIESA